jgi:hypothetical protein
VPGCTVASPSSSHPAAAFASQLLLRGSPHHNRPSTSARTMVCLHQGRTFCCRPRRAAVLQHLRTRAPHVPASRAPCPSSRRPPRYAPSVLAQEVGVARSTPHPLLRLLQRYPGRGPPSPGPCPPRPPAGSAPRCSSGLVAPGHHAPLSLREGRAAPAHTPAPAPPERPHRPSRSRPPLGAARSSPRAPRRQPLAPAWCRPSRRAAAPLAPRCAPKCRCRPLGEGGPRAPPLPPKPSAAQPAPHASLKQQREGSRGRPQEEAPPVGKRKETLGRKAEQRERKNREGREIGLFKDLCAI